MNQYVEYFEGNMPLIISVPHGGSLCPDDIPNREHGTFKKDRATEDVAKEIRSAFEALGLRPYLVVMKLHRKKIDVNRGTREGAPTVAAKEIHKEYHRALFRARKAVLKNFNGGLLVDLHGQKHRQGFVEVGFSIPKSKINRLSLASLKYLKDNSSFGALLDRGFKPKEIVTGPNSLGSLLEDAGYSVMPSKNHPKIDHRHFNGVYIMHRHVVTKREGIAGLNLELCYEGVRDSRGNRVKFAASFVQATIIYLNEFFGFKK